MLKKYCDKISECLHKQEERPSRRDINNKAPDIAITMSESTTISETIDTKQTRTNISKIDWSLPKQPDVYYREHEIYEKFYLTNDFYINDFGRKRILFINYREKFPIKGWFHECMECHTPTGKNFIVKGVVPPNIYIHICSGCYCRLEYWRRNKTPEYYNVIAELNYVLGRLPFTEGVDISY